MIKRLSPVAWQHINLIGETEGYRISAIDFLKSILARKARRSNSLEVIVGNFAVLDKNPLRNSKDP